MTENKVISFTTAKVPATYSPAYFDNTFIPNLD